MAAPMLAAEPPSTSASIMSAVTPGTLDLRRLAQIVRGGPTDHVGDVVIVPWSSLDMQKTVFGKLTGLAKMMMTDKMSQALHWSDAAVILISNSYASVPKPLAHDQALLEFMATQCNFAMEHADGSFMDHLQFCYEYGAAHYKKHSPRVLLLHSILGVGTNYFPMEVDKVPKLQALLSEEEFRHTEAFPCLLRLINHGPLLEELMGCSGARLEGLEGISFHRVIDNQPMSMSVEDLWVHFNYQLIHLLDFLPVKDWNIFKADYFLQNTAALHGLLTRCGKLEAKVDLNLKPLIPIPMGAAPLPQPPNTLGSLIRKYAPVSLQIKAARKQIAAFSAQIKHDLSYELHWKAPTTPQSRL